jgi:hypothetical protein
MAWEARAEPENAPESPFVQAPFCKAKLAGQSALWALAADTLESKRATVNKAMLALRESITKSLIIGIRG